MTFAVSRLRVGFLIPATLVLVAGATLGGHRAVADEAVSPVDEEGRVVQFERDIVPIFRERCLDCHGPDDAKNDFRIDDPDTVLGYLEPGDASSSTLYTDFLISEDPELLMPPMSHQGPLPPDELALVGWWINEGADWPEGVRVSEASAMVAELPPPPVATGFFGRVYAAQGYLHPATVHFPIALLLMGAAFVVVGWKWPALGTQIPMACLIVGALTSIGASMMGWSFAVQQGYGGWNRFDQGVMDSEVFWHRWSAVIVTVLSVVFSIIAARSLKTGDERLTRIWKIGLIVCAMIIGAVGHQGGEMTYGKDFYPKMFRVLLGTQDDAASLPPESPQAE